jgi:signal transduction histidine kinase
VGTGLSLAVVHGIVKKYDRAIKAKASKEPAFHIYLPKALINTPIEAERIDDGGSSESC